MIKLPNPQTTYTMREQIVSHATKENLNFSSKAPHKKRLNKFFSLLLTMIEGIVNKEREHVGKLKSTLSTALAYLPLTNITSSKQPTFHLLQNRIPHKLRLKYLGLTNKTQGKFSSKAFLTPRNWSDHTSCLCIKLHKEFNHAKSKNWFQNPKCRIWKDD